MIAFSRLCGENATMVEHGLIQAADAVEVVPSGHTKSRYAPLVLPKYGDVTKTLAMFYVEEPPNGDGLSPSEYMMILGDGAVTVDLEGVASTGVVEVRVDYDSGRLADLVDEVDRIDGVQRTAHADNSVGECEDLVIGYRMYARMEHGRWSEYLHGPLTFQCNQATDAYDKSALHPSGPTTSSPSGGTGRTGQGHNFDHGIGGGPGGFDGAFLTDDTVTAGGESLLPTSGVVLIDIWSDSKLGAPDSKYTALVVSRCDDVDQLIATVRLPTSDHGGTEQPDQFMLVLDDNAMQIQLELHGADVRLVKSSREIQDICEQLLEDNPDSKRDGFETHEGDCRDILIQYRMFGRKLAHEWLDYAHGPLLFQCCGDYALPDSHGKIRPPYAGPFMTKNAPGFMPQFMSNKDEEA